MKAVLVICTYAYMCICECMQMQCNKLYNAIDINITSEFVISSYSASYAFLNHFELRDNWAFVSAACGI